MSWLTRVLGDANARRLGPGRLVLIVGPSGAGKDALIDAARRACRDQPDIVFPRRIITRAASDAEDHDTIAPEAFDRAAADGAFALWWVAHGLKYAIPLSVESDIAAGHSVVCNVSRALVAQARERYANVAVVLVTAPPEVLAARLQRRARASDGSIAQRVGRSVADLHPDFIIENIGTVETAARKLVSVLLGRELVLGL